mgnify:CR=1 FL=1
MVVCVERAQARDLRSTPPVVTGAGLASHDLLGSVPQERPLLGTRMVHTTLRNTGCRPAPRNRRYSVLRARITWGRVPSCTRPPHSSLSPSHRR